MMDGDRLGWRQPRRMGQALLVAALAGLLTACGAGPGEHAVTEGPRGTPEMDHAPTAPAAAAADASFRAVVTGDLDLVVEGESALAGARFGRYHFSFSGRSKGDGGIVIISFARTDTASPQAGRYRLGEGGDFDGNVEIHPGPADYAIEEGELVITDGSGDQLAGRYVFSAVERAGSATIAVEGEFQTRAVD